MAKPYGAGRVKRASEPSRQGALEPHPQPTKPGSAMAKPHGADRFSGLRAAGWQRQTF